MAEKDIIRMPNELDPFGEASGFDMTALELARGPQEIRRAALGVLFSGVSHLDGDWDQVVQLASTVYTEGLLTTAQYEAVQRIDETTTTEEFDRLLDMVRRAFARLDPVELKQMALRTVTEDERPPMQFGADDGDPFVEVVEPTLPTRRGPIQGAQAQTLAREQLRKVGIRPQPKTTATFTAAPMNPKAMAAEQLRRSGYGKRGTAR